MQKFVNEVIFMSDNHVNEITIVFDLRKNLPILYGVSDNELFDNFHVDISKMYSDGCIPIKPQYYHTLFNAGVVNAVIKHVPYDILGSRAYLCKINTDNFIDVL